jgi:uncharacterized protein (TIGR03435 family)
VTDKRTYRAKLRLAAVGPAVVAGACALVCMGPASVRAAQAQQENGAPLLFELASIRPTQLPCKDSGFTPTPNGLHILCMPLQIIIQQAYGIYESSQVGGIPESMGWTFYDVEAKVDDSEVAAYGKLSSGQRDLMFQMLLRDRFKLKAHRESKDLPVYALVIARNGSKLKESKPGEADAQAGPLAQPIMWRKGRGQIVSRSSPLSSFPRLLSQEVGRPVVDRTGLTGSYDFTLQWTPDQGASSTPVDAGPSLFTALEEQLGLKLEPAKAPLDILVIDHIEKPSEN